MKDNVKALKSVDELINLAKEYGAEDNPLFTSTLDRYITQIKILEELKKTISESDVLVTKEYVKGRGNYYTHPAITEYNRTTDSANKTVATLIKIIKGFGADNDTKEDDPLLKLMESDNDEIN